VCIAEGGKVFCDEDGNIRFETRQHYQQGNEYKHSVASFTFDDMTDIQTGSPESNLINKMSITVNPRKIVALDTIWTYGEYPLIAAGASLELWASLNDPAYSITTPAATTDYQGNTASDGSGTDRTSDVSISISKFAQAAHMTITNTSGTDLYLNKLQLRGESAQRLGAVTVMEEDTASQTRYGLFEKSIEESDHYNKYFQDTVYARQFCQQIIDYYAQPASRVVLKRRALPQLQIGDMVSVYNKDVRQYFMQRVVGIKIEGTQGSLNMTLTTRRIPDSELANYFTIGTSSIGGSDIIPN
jgi:hypothetical protein